MLPEHVQEHDGLPGAEVRAALDTWRSGLVDLTGANPLLNFPRVAGGAVEITGPSPKSIVKVLQEGGALSFPGHPAGGASGGHPAGSASGHTAGSASGHPA